MLHMIIWRRRVQTYVTSKMCNVRTYTAHEFEIIFIQTNVTYGNV